MTVPDDLKVYEAICDAGDDGLTADELAERFETDMWTMLDVCRKLQGERLIASRTRKGTSLYMWVRREPDPPSLPRPAKDYYDRTEPFS